MEIATAEVLTKLFPEPLKMNILQQKYPHIPGITEVCIRCCGNPVERYGTGKCYFCQRTRSHWRQAGFEAASNELMYLWKIWKSCNIYKQESTGIKDIDNILLYLWGKPWEFFLVPLAVRRKIEAVRNVLPGSKRG